MNNNLKIVSVFPTEKYLKIFLINNNRIIFKNLIIYLYDFNVTFKSQKEIIDNRIRVSIKIIINIENINPKFINGFPKEFKNKDFQRPDFRRIRTDSNKNNSGNNKYNIISSSVNNNKNIKFIIK